MQESQDTGEKDDSQYNFVEGREPSEFVMCLILAAAYLGLAKYCWAPLLAANSWKLLLNVEGFFIIIALLALLIGARPYINPSSLQISKRGIKYLGPYWPRRKTVNWQQVIKIYVSSELILVHYRPDPKRKKTWLLVIPSIYLAGHDQIPDAVRAYSPIEPITMTTPALLSRITFAALFLIVILWLLELMINPAGSHVI